MLQLMYFGWIVEFFKEIKPVKFHLNVSIYFFCARENLWNLSFRIKPKAAHRTLIQAMKIWINSSFTQIIRVKNSRCYCGRYCLCYFGHCFGLHEFVSYLYIVLEPILIYTVSFYDGSPLDDAWLGWLVGRDYRIHILQINLIWILNPVCFVRIWTRPIGAKFICSFWALLLSISICPPTSNARCSHNTSIAIRQCISLEIHGNWIKGMENRRGKKQTAKTHQRKREINRKWEEKRKECISNNGREKWRKQTKKIDGTKMKKNKKKSFNRR